jgi:cytochrome b6-f complex iron-sulfur subunit
MIVILRPGVTPEEVAAVEELVQAEGLRSERSPGEERDVLLVIGETRDALRLEAALAAQPACERVVPILPQRRYERIFSRRSFIDVFVGSIAAVFALLTGAAGLLFLSRSGEERRKRKILRAGSVADFEQRGYRLVDYEGKPIMVIRSGTGGYHALSATCTHSEVCQVEWRPNRQELECPCHRAAFDVFGNVLHGPPPRPLPVYPVEVIGDGVYLKVHG